MLRPKQRMTTAETWDARQKVGPDVAAENGQEACSAVLDETEKDERGSFGIMNAIPRLEALPEETQPAA